MTNLFIRILNMSMTGALIILAVLALRLLLRRAPRIFSYGLWAVVLFRLLCPISFESRFSLLGVLNAPVEKGTMEYISGTERNAPAAETTFAQTSSSEEMIPDPAAGRNTAPGAKESGKVQRTVSETLRGLLPAGAAVWLAGVCIFLLLGAVSYGRFVFRLRAAEKIPEGGQKRVFRTDAVSMPFVVGFFRPCIYLPAGLPEQELDYILLHERIHLRRGDNMTRAAAWLALCLHWFNPLVWLAFFLSGRDMEMSCDEAVIRRAGNQIKKAYSASLLALTSGRKISVGIPLAFGEGDPGSRIKNILHYKKPAFWLAAAVLAVCVLTGAFLLGNPKKDEKEQEEEVFYVYGVVTESEEFGGDVVLIPKLGEMMRIPAAQKVEPYYEMEFDGLAPGHLVRIALPEETVILETYPGQFSEKADSIEVMGEGFVLQTAPDGGYLLGVPLGMAREAKAGDTLDIYHAVLEEGNLMENYHLFLLESPEKVKTELLAETQVLAVDPENYDIMVELSREETDIFLSEFGFGVSCEVKTGGAQETDGAQGTNGQQETDRQQGTNGQSEPEEEIRELDSEIIASGEIPDGTYWVYARSINRSGRSIDRYVIPFGMSEDEAVFLPVFSDDCVFYGNREMDSVRFEEIGFDEFAELVTEGTSWINVPVRCVFREGLIEEAYLMSTFLGQGISYEPLTFNYSMFFEDFLAMEGYSMEEALAEFYELVRTEEADVSDAPGMERMEIYLGNIGDGDSGVVLFYDQDGNLLHTEDAHIARVAWNNVYLGERNGIPYLMTMHIEDRDDYGEYWYQVFRLDEAGTPRQIAGSDFQWGDSIVYDDDLFRKWADGMETYLADSHLLMSSQEGELRAEAVCEADRYCYETLRRQ